MMTTYSLRDGACAVHGGPDTPEAIAASTWIDLLNPTPEEERAVQAEQLAEARFFNGGFDAVNGIADGFEDAADTAFATFILFGIGRGSFGHGCRFRAMGKEKPAGSGFGRQRCDQAAALILALRRLFRRAALFL